jgi:hypothetical protein
MSCRIGHWTGHRTGFFCGRLLRRGLFARNIDTYHRRDPSGGQREQESDRLELCRAVAASFNQLSRRAFCLPENRERM